MFNINNYNTIHTVKKFYFDGYAQRRYDLRYLKANPKAKVLFLNQKDLIVLTSSSSFPRNSVGSLFKNMDRRSYEKINNAVIDPLDGLKPVLYLKISDEVKKKFIVLSKNKKKGYVVKCHPQSNLSVGDKVKVEQGQFIRYNKSVLIKSY